MNLRMISIIAGMACLFACTQKAEQLAEEKSILQPDYETATKDILDGSPSPTPQQPSQTEWKRQIIKQANINIRVKDFKTAHNIISSQVIKAGGYVSNDSERQDNDYISGDMTIKVPADKLDWMITSIIESGDSLLFKNISSDDRTAEFVDTKARIAAKEKARDKYYEFLEKAKTIDEVLKVQKEIATMQEDIEAAASRVAYISQQSDNSTIYLSYHQPLNPTDKTGFFKELVESGKTGFVLIKNIVLAAVSIWPLLAAGLLAFFIYRKKRLASNRKQVNK